MTVPADVMAEPSGEPVALSPAALSDEAAPGARPRRGFGIRYKILIAFLVVAAMVVTSGVVAWLSLRRIEAKLAEVVHHAVPAMSIAEALAVEASAIVGSTATLTAALTEEQREALMLSLAGQIEGLNHRLSELAEIKVDEPVLAALRERIAKLSTNLNRQGNLVGLRISLASQVHGDATQLALSHKQFLAAVDPHIEETYRSLFTGIKTLVADLGAPPPSTSAAPAQPAPPDATVRLEPARQEPTRQDMEVLQRRIALLFNRNVGEMLALLQLAAAGNLAAGLLNEVILVTDASQVHQLRNRFGEITIAMGAIRLNLATTPANQVLLGLTTPMLQYGLGSDNLFDRRLRELELINASDAVVTENRALSADLTVAVGQLVAAARAEAERSASAVEQDAAYARLMETVAALFAMVMTVLIGWRYVGRRIIGRLLALQQAMEGEAAGREIVIPDVGEDEIGEMAGALNHFVSRRKQAEADLRSAKEHAESAFAELKELQETLVQAQKMAALGRLVAGVAHELNTPVGVCLTAASLMTERTEDLARSFEAGQLRKSSIQDYLGVATEISTLVRTNLERAGDLIRVFKQVAIDPGEDERLMFQVRDQIDNALGLLADKMRPSPHSVIVDCQPGLTIDGFPEALRQALTVLIDNTLTHAFTADSPGTITITGSASAPLTGADAPPGSVVLTVADNGAGIPLQDQPHLFEPFFTTRRGRGGLGLGLHMVFNIVTSVLGGRIAVESQPGQGSRFTITIPSRSPAAASLGQRR